MPRYIFARITPINWRNAREYIAWHDLNSFFERHPKTKIPVIESSVGNRFVAIYDMYTDTLVVDIANSIPEVLYECNWDYDHTICMTIDESKLQVFWEHPGSKKVLKTLLDGDFGNITNYLCDDRKRIK